MLSAPIWYGILSYHSVLRSYRGKILLCNWVTSTDIHFRLGALLGQTNCFLAKLGSLRVDVKSRLFHSYCSSFYGCELWRPDDKCLDTIVIAWRKAFRRILALPFTTHCSFLPGLMGGLPASDIIFMRWASFVLSCLLSSNIYARSLAHLTAQDANSRVGYIYTTSFCGCVLVTEL